MTRLLTSVRTLMMRLVKDESGAMTVEWVAIAAAVAVGAVALTWSVLNNLDPVAAAIGSNLTDAVGTIQTPQ